MEEEELQRLYTWIDQIPLSRPKRNITRDFADGVLVAEIVGHFQPKIIDLHNYTPANSAKQKQSNWETLGRKVFSKLSLVVPENVVKAVVEGKPGVAEVVLNNLRLKLEQFEVMQRAEAVSPVSQERSGWGEFDRRPPPTIAAAVSVASNNKAGQLQPSPSKKKPAGKSNGYDGDSTDPYLQGPKHPSTFSVGQSSMGSDYSQVLLEKDQSIMDYQETVEILQVKVKKLEQLALLKDKRIDELTKKLKANGIKP